ncbi:MAG: putative acyltransferase [Methanomassiliicoccales archaeon PtaU1.Bin124]|nr:MAG: putative acyltransferase [Methanomassiliicoccales archaeon PtaU1.Bin124]
MLVAEVDGALVATGTLAGSEIKRVFVDPSHQGEGWGRTIMAHLEKEAKRIGLSTVELDASIPAKPFYDHLAYETVAEQERALRSDSLRYYRMKRSLSASYE